MRYHDSVMMANPYWLWLYDTYDTYDTFYRLKKNKIKRIWYRIKPNMYPGV
jgi:hypothetical protein